MNPTHVLVRIEKPKIILRELVRADVPLIHAFASDADFLKHQSWGPNSLEETKNFVDSSILEQQQTLRTNYNLAVLARNNLNSTETSFVGNIALLNITTISEEAEIGFNIVLGSQGKGYATDASNAILEFGIKTLGLARIYAYCSKKNESSIRVLQKIGMTLEKHIKDHKMIRGELRDSLMFTITKDKYLNKVATQHL